MSPRTNTAPAAGTWQLGDHTVNRVGFGAMRLTGNLPFDRGVPRDRDRSIGVLRRAIELGVNHIDTAAFYFSATRSANELINRALAPYPEDLVITTKVWPGRDPSGAWWWAAPATVARPSRGEPAPTRSRSPGRGEPARATEPHGPARSASTSARWPNCAMPGLSATLASPMSRPSNWLRPGPSPRSSACRTPTGSVRRARTGHSCGSAVNSASPSSRSSRSLVPGARRVQLPATARRCAPSPAHTVCPSRRSGWPGPCSRGHTCWRSRGPVIRTTSRRTWRPARFGSRKTRWHVSPHCGRSEHSGATADRNPMHRPPLALKGAASAL